MIFAHLNTAPDSSRETKNAIRYSEDASGKPPIIGTLYVQKWLLGEGILPYPYGEHGLANLGSSPMEALTDYLSQKPSSATARSPSTS